MELNVVWLGLLAGSITSLGFIPQLVKGYRTKKLDDVSYLMPVILGCGMLLWLIYGIFINDLPIIAANIFGIGCNISLVVLKKVYEKSPQSNNI
jgi:MtN3 and saliva related transmembrane protein